jgi:hypothetical protein
MHIIDEMQAAIWRNAANSKGCLPLSQLDPVVFVAHGEFVWTLGMVQSMWQGLIDRAHQEVFARRL